MRWLPPSRRSSPSGWQPSDASPHTISAYRDAWRLLLTFARDRVRKAPSQLDFVDLDARLVSAFLTSLEAERGNSASTRNARLTAIRSLFRYAATLHPEHAGLIMRVLAIPSKRHDQTMICFLNPDEVDALLAAPNPDTWHGRRDHALLTLTVQTGLRVSELTSLTISDIHLGAGANVHCFGKAVALLLRVLQIGASTFCGWASKAAAPCERDEVDRGLLSIIFEIWTASGWHLRRGPGPPTATPRRDPGVSGSSG
ncbi:tyrosine-type recombinase/integrase [Virgisporangium aurantiacum]|uniref:Integrase n=1 Tax=Virgisporangium aurantiacum TaxID=175570 RepID=A0A8J3ZI82_9ACTN|nr:tyrosine-type recombinase/integrase [Virgisporangium aurantiacum]GIJ64699.1 hypothetical protein Vau01_122150 [Virgisporangium aurantiacum]